MAGRAKAFKIAAAVVVAVLLVLVAAPFLIDANRFRPQIEQELSSHLGRLVEIGSLHASLLRGELHADQISIADDPSFSRNPFLTAESLAVGVEVMPLVLHRLLEVRSVTIQAPRVQLLRTPAGAWNFASLGGQTASTSQSSSDTASLSSFSVAKLSITNATVSLGRPSNPSEIAFQQVNFTASNLSGTAQFPFDLAATTSGRGSVKLQAQFGPVGSLDVDHVPFHGTLEVLAVPATEVEKLLAVLGYGLPEGSSLRSGTLEAHVTLEGPFARLVATGPVQLSDATLAGFSLTQKLSGALGSASNTGNDTTIEKFKASLHYAADGLRADDLQMVMSALGSLAGSGMVGANNSLNFHLTAKLAPNTAIAQLPILGGVVQSGQLPFRVTGTTARPEVVPEVGSLAKTLANPQTIQGIATTLLGKKKRP